jgi:hypothetical protein
LVEKVFSGLEIRQALREDSGSVSCGTELEASFYHILQLSLEVNEVYSCGKYDEGGLLDWLGGFCCGTPSCVPVATSTAGPSMSISPVLKGTK